MMQKITTFIWFDDNAEEAVRFYISIFKNSKINQITRYGENEPGPKGTVKMISFQLEGQEFFALNGGPVFKLTPAISLFVNCATQEEVDYLWERLSDCGEIQECGWLTDKFGVTWQIVPNILIELLNDRDEVKASRVMQTMLTMKKLDINRLKQAYDQD